MTLRILLPLLFASLLLQVPVLAQPVAAAQDPAGLPKAAVGAPQPGHAVRPETPRAIVEALHATMLEAMKKADKLGFDGRYALLEPVIARSFDLQFMASKCVGRHWKKLTEDERELWLGRFSRLTTSNYAGRFNGYKGEHFETLGEKAAAHSTRVVLTRVVVPGDDDVSLNYRLKHGSDGWRIIDVYLKGTVSELALRRSEYSTTLKRDGFAKLTAAIDRKIADLRAKGGS